MPLASFLTSRATLFCIGLLSHWALISPSQKLNHWHMDPRPWLDIWVGWDSQWYANIVQHGYHQYIATGPGGVPPEQGVAFFPLYPLLTWILDQLVADPLLSGVLVANLCAVGALWLLYVYGKKAWGEAQARWAVAGAAFYPHSFMLSCMYSESLFLLLLTGMLVAAQRDRWWLVGLLGALLSATRVLGISVGLGFLVMYLLEKRRREPGGWRWTQCEARVLWLGLIPLGLLAFMWHLHLASGNALAFLEAQAGFGRSFQWPWDGVWRAFTSGDPGDLYMGGFLLFALALLAVLAWLRRWAELCLAIPLLMAPLFSGNVHSPLWSLPRFTLVIVPFYGALGWLMTRHAAAGWLTVLFMATFNGMLMVLWVTGKRIVI